MNPNHKPATPLPWELVYGKLSEVSSPPFLGRIPLRSPWIEDAFEEGSERHPIAVQNMEYIARACNAYPKLVEALRAICKAEAEDSLPSNATASVNSARALLRDLGEE